MSPPQGTTTPYPSSLREANTLPSNHSSKLLLRCTYNAIKNYRGQSQVAHKLFVTLTKCFIIDLEDRHVSFRAGLADHIEPLTALFDLPHAGLSDEIHQDTWDEARNAALDLTTQFFTPSPGWSLEDEDFYDAFLTHPERIPSLTRYANILRRTYDQDHPRLAGPLFHRLARRFNEAEAQYQHSAVIEFKEAYTRLPPESLHGEDAA